MCKETWEVGDSADVGFRGGWLGEEHLIAPRDVEQA